MTSVDDLLGRASAIDALGDAEVEDLERELVSAFRAVRAGDVEGVDPNDVEMLRTLRDGITRVRASAEARRVRVRAEQAAKLEAEILGEAPTEPEKITPTEAEVSPEPGAPGEDAARAASAAALEAEVLGITDTEPTPSGPHEVASAGAASIRERRELLLWGLAGFVIAGLVTAGVFLVTGGGEDQASKPRSTTSTTGAPATAPPTTAPATTAPPASQLVVPTNVNLNAVCDPGPTEPLCSLTFTWTDNSTGETGYRVYTTSQTQGGAPTEWDLSSNSTSWTQPWNSGDYVCARVAALGPTLQEESSGESCASTGIG